MRVVTLARGRNDHYSRTTVVGAGRLLEEVITRITGERIREGRGGEGRGGEIGV